MLLTTFGLYECLVLPRRMTSVYSNKILVTFNATFEDHFMILNESIKRLNYSGVQINATKNKWCTTELKFLVLWLLDWVIIPKKELRKSSYSLAQKYQIG